MIDIELLSEIAMEIIVYAGVAKSSYIMALQEVKNGNYLAYDELIKNGNKNYSKAHEVHQDLLIKEMTEKTPYVSLLIMHAEDQLLNCETIKFVVEEFVDLRKNKI